MLKKYKVSYVSDLRGRYSPIKPLIRLGGDWLKEQGFDIGTHFDAVVEHGKIILTVRENNER